MHMLCGLEVDAAARTFRADVTLHSPVPRRQHVVRVNEGTTHLALHALATCARGALTPAIVGRSSRRRESGRNSILARSTATSRFQTVMLVYVRRDAQMERADNGYTIAKRCRRHACITLMVVIFKHASVALTFHSQPLPFRGRHILTTTSWWPTRR